MHALSCPQRAGELAESLRAGVEQLQGDWERPKE